MATLPTLPAPAVDPSRPTSGARRIARNLARLLGGKVVAGLLSLVYLVVVTHRLGARDYGVLVLINGYAIAVGSLVAFSGFHGVVRYGQLALERGDRAGLARLVRFMAVLELGCGLVAILVAAALVPLVAGRFGWSPEAARLAVPYSLAVLGTVRATPQGLLQMADRFDLIAAHGTVSPLIRFAGTMAVWAGGGGLSAFLLVWLASSVAEGGAMWLLAAGSWRRLTGGAPLAGPWRSPAAPGFGRFILATNADLTLRELAPNLAPLTVGWLLGPAAAGLLTLAQRSTNALQQPAMLLSQASYAVLAEQAAQGAIAQLRATVARSAALAAAGAVPVVAVLAIWGEALLRLVGGRSFGTGATLVPLLAAGSMAALVAAPVAAGLAAIGRPHRSVTVTMAVNLGLFPMLPLLLRAMGVAGAGWQLLLQNLAAATLLALFLSRDTRG